MSRSPQDYALKIEGLTKSFGDFTAVNQIHFELEYGRIFGYLGANGAGKSTTLRMLTGILKPTSGKAWVAGADLIQTPEKVKPLVGYVSQRFSLYEDLTIRENLDFFSSVYGLRAKERQKRIEEVLEMTQMQNVQHRLAGHLSGGWKQRLAIANAILHKPKVLFLDEPTAGLDPIVRRLVWELLYKLTQEGMALFVTTHYMEEAERCHHLAILSHGKILMQGSPESIRKSLSDDVIRVTCDPLMLASRIFQDIEGVRGLTVYSHALHLNLGRHLDIQELHVAAKRHGISIFEIEKIEPTLEDVFATLEQETSPDGVQTGSGRK
jgi:ABC-2 type transport system ATP-binding protein